MPDNSVLENSVPEKRPSRFRQFSMRTLLVLVALAALGCLFVRNEMVREERRGKFLAELEAKGATWDTRFESALYPASRPPRLWRQPIGAWLRGKPMVLPRAGAKFPNGTPLERFREFLDLFPTVRRVEIDGGDATTEALRLLAQLGPIDELKITNPLVIDKEKARLLARIKCDVGLWIQRQEISDVVLTNLADAGANVRYFGDDWRNSGDEGLRAIARLPKCWCAHASCRGTDEGVRALAKHPGLTNLTLEGTNYTDASADVIPTLPKLQTIHFTGTSHTDAGLAKAITGCRADTFEFENVTVGEQTIAALAKAPNLYSLYFKDVDLTLEQWDALAKLTIRHLMIDSKSFSDEKVTRLSPLAKSLDFLYLRTPQVTDAGLAWLKQAKGLTGLRLDDTQTTSATWLSLPSLASLQQVGMGGTNVNGETLACTSRMTALFYIVLTGDKIDDAALDLLRPGIALVTLSDTRVTPDGLKKLAQRKGMKDISVGHESGTPSLITEADAKEAQAVAGLGVQVRYYEASASRCE